MIIIDFKHSDPAPSPQHNSSWLTDNQPATSSVPPTSSSPTPHSIPLAPSNSLTGISTHHPPAPTTPLRTSSSSTVHPSSHPSRATSDLYPTQHPSAPRHSPLPHHSPTYNHNNPANLHLDALNFPINNTNANNANNNNNTHSTLTKFGNLLNVSNAAVQHDRSHDRVRLARSTSNQGESYNLGDPYNNLPSHSYANPAQSLSAPIEYRPVNRLYDDHRHLNHPDSTPHDRPDVYEPMHRPHFPSQTYSHPHGVHNQDHLNPQYPNNYHQNYYRQTSHAYYNNSSPPYPGTAPMPVYKERTYGIPKFNTAITSQGDVGRPTASCSLPCFKPMPNETEPVSEPMPSESKSPPIVTTLQPSSSPKVGDFALGGRLLRDTIQAFKAKGVSRERAEFLSDYTELMKAYEEKCDAVYDATEYACMELILKSRVPLLRDTITAPVDDETPEDARQKLVVKKRFVEAMEALQGDKLPTKRRGNLPKEGTEYLKKWSDEHFDHPYPTDEEKLEMSKRTKIGMAQISNWFINYRKRVWKQSLPPNHPALTGDHMKKARKKQKTSDSGSN